MNNKRTAPGSYLAWAIGGALIGGLNVAVDGAVLGVFLAGDGGEGALRWAGYGGTGGAVLGAIVGVIARAIGPRMVLRPPEENESGGSSKPGRHLPGGG